MRRRARSPGTSCCENDSVTLRIASYFDHDVRGVALDGSFSPHPVTALLLKLLGDVEKAQPTVLDLGCGAGATAIHLAGAGARRVTGLDLSPASIETAGMRATQAGLGDDRARFEVSDAATAPLPRHDWVLLDRVVCCFHDVEDLLDNAMAGSDSMVAFTAPESRGWRGAVNRVGWAAENLWKAVLPRPTCRGYVHDIEALDHPLIERGFRKVRDGRSGLWFAAVYEKLEKGQPQPDPRTA